ncbi:MULTISPECIES: antibiotic biosynthesis monooxygenase family protein [Shouchella]|uniref:Antibiotic biosynthesis monooxygenase n=2 Tax=Shouchella TaxID=2893057 RepID=A0ABY7W1H4_9BACI|nr:MULTISPECIES: antibiotic biosynthesis monooxygenase family protein [Shouchella]MED4129527.1 antibiotic biosynthesis monooxygenase [Shouchella miscanthi]WDF02792.1 antibiotic biosynthesis monooxygenase [Shouchella hunanensis]
MYIVMNELHVSPEKKKMLHERFGKASTNMANVKGCLEFMFLSNEQDHKKEIVFTKWASKEDYQNWLSSESFANAHKSNAASKEQKPAANANELHTYELIHHFQGE